MRAETAALLLLLAIAAVPACAAQQIEDPENVTYMDATSMQSGKLKLSSSSPAAMAEGLTLRLYVPQNDSRQQSEVARVIGPDSYSMEEDPYGNALIALSWKKPPLDRDIDYAVETSVRTTSASSGQYREFPVTDVIEADSGIIEAAYTAAGGNRNAEGALSMAAWVNDNVAYDLSYEDRAYPARWVFAQGRGTCDEFSNLLLSMLRATGYDAWYAAGYAYLGGRQEGESTFGSHAWVETRVSGKTYGIDPTWAESPLDATHITFARLPDSNFTEHTTVRSRDVSLSWDKDETRIEIEHYEESPRVEIGTEVFPAEVGGGERAALIAGISADGCVLTSARFASCVNEDGSSMLSIGDESFPAVFCGEKEIHVLAMAPEVKRGMKYTCPVTFSAGGARERMQLSITSEPSEDLSVSISTKKIAVAMEEFTVTAALSGSDAPEDVRVLAFLGEEMKAARAYAGRGESVSLDFPFTAPHDPREYVLTVLAGTGDSASEKITVVAGRSMSISGIEYPAAIQEGTDCTVAATALNSGDATDASVAFILGGDSQGSRIALPAAGNATAHFNCSGLPTGRHPLTVSLLDASGAYQDSWTGAIEVAANPSFKEDVTGFLEGIILQFIEFLKSFLKGG